MKRAALLWMVILICSTAAFGQMIDQTSNFPVGIWTTFIAPVDDEIVWCSGGRYAGVGEQGWFGRTLDGGSTWSAATVPLSAKQLIANITAISAEVAWISAACNPTQGDNCVYKTSDGGQSWTRQSNGMANYNTWLNFVYFFDAHDGLAVFNQDSTGYSRHFYTRDGGETWTRVAPADDVPMLPGEYSLGGCGCVAGEALFWGAYCDSPPTTGRVFRTTDRGKSWSVIQTPYSSPGSIFLFIAFKDSMNGMVTSNDLNSYINSISITHNGGATWHAVKLPGAKFVGVTPIPGTEAGYMAAGDEGTAFTLDDGATWTQIDDMPTNWIFFASRTAGWTGVYLSQSIRKWQIGQPPAIGCYPLTGMDFGKLLAGQESEPYSLSITNYGQDPLVISEIIPPGAYFRLHDPFPLPRTLQSLETARIKISFMPAAGEVMRDSVVFVSNAPLTPQHAVQLTGEGIVIDRAESDRLYAVTAKSLYTLDTASGTATKITDMTLTKANSLLLYPGRQELLGVSTTTNKTEIHAISATDGKTILLHTIPVGPMRALAFRADTLYGASLSGDFYRINLATGEAILAG
ncbi:MAG TPA: hypothetical protein PKJ13_12920, partial [bacterium]|nr:hypothetical protein [bacterium]